MLRLNLPSGSSAGSQPSSDSSRSSSPAPSPRQAAGAAPAVPESLLGLDALKASSFPDLWQLTISMVSTLLQVPIEFREEARGSQIPQAQNPYRQLSSAPKPITVAQKSVANAVFANEYPSNPILSRIRSDIGDKKPCPEAISSDLHLPHGLMPVQKDLSLAEFLLALKSGAIVLSEIQDVAGSLKFTYPSWNAKLAQCDSAALKGVQHQIEFRIDLQTKVDNKIRRLTAEHCPNDFPDPVGLLGDIQNLTSKHRALLQGLCDEVGVKGFAFPLFMKDSAKLEEEKVEVLADEMTGLIIRSDTDIQGIGYIDTPWGKAAADPVSLLKGDEEGVQEAAKEEIVAAIKQFLELAQSALQISKMEEDGSLGKENEPSQITDFRCQVLAALKQDMLGDEDVDDDQVARFYLARFTNGRCPGTGSPLLIFAGVIMEFLYRRLLMEKYPKALIDQLGKDEFRAVCALAQHQADANFDPAAKDRQKVKAAPPENISAYVPRIDAALAMPASVEEFAQIARAGRNAILEYTDLLAFQARLFSKEDVIDFNLWLLHGANLSVRGQEMGVSYRYSNEPTETGHGWTNYRARVGTEPTHRRSLTPLGGDQLKLPVPEKSPTSSPRQRVSVFSRPPSGGSAASSESSSTAAVGALRLRHTESVEAYASKAVQRQVSRAELRFGEEACRRFVAAEVEQIRVKLRSRGAAPVAAAASASASPRAVGVFSGKRGRAAGRAPRAAAAMGGANVTGQMLDELPSASVARRGFVGGSLRARRDPLNSPRGAGSAKPSRGRSNSQ